MGWINGPDGKIIPSYKGVPLEEDDKKYLDDLKRQSGTQVRQAEEAFDKIEKKRNKKLAK